MKPELLNRAGIPVLGIEIGPNDLENWEPTIPQMRECVLRWFVTGPDFSPWCDDEMRAEAAQFAPSQKEVEKISLFTHDAVTYGRVIDFGYWPNEAIKQGGKRGGPMWSRGFLGMPFMEPWVLYHLWEGLPGIYLVNPVGDKPTGSSFEVCELQPCAAQGNQMLAISDRGLFKFPDEPFTDWNRYGAMIMPSTARFLPGATDLMNNSQDPAGAAAGNIGDPVMLALMILNTRNVDRATVAASDKLQKARARSNKPPIPPYMRVNSAPYVTAIVNRARARDQSPGTGTHASPVPHIRRGHPRQYADGRSIFVRDAIVGVTDQARAEFLRTRSHYTVKGDQ